MKCEAAKKWRLVVGLAAISATFVVSSRLCRLLPADQTASILLEFVVACFDHSQIQIPMHKNISVFQLKTS